MIGLVLSVAALVLLVCLIAWGVNTIGSGWADQRILRAFNIFLLVVVVICLVVVVLHLFGYSFHDINMKGL